MTSSYTLDCRQPFLIVTFREPHQVLSWSITHPGKHVATRVAWLEVRNSDLPKDIDAASFASQKLAAHGLDDAITLMTSADIREYYQVSVTVDEITASCVTTVGLTNSERVGSRFSTHKQSVGTINTLVQTSCPLSEAAFLETLSIATQARTTAVLDCRPERHGVAITGTGTDCMAIAAPTKGHEVTFAGLHTALGEAVGAAVYQATHNGVQAWMRAQTETR